MGNPKDNQKLVGIRRSKLNENTVREAVSALLAFHKKKQDKPTSELLLNETTNINLIISLWKITGQKAKTFPINIPHPLRTAETEVCLFIKDEDKDDSETTARNCQELLLNKGVTEVSEVMPLQVLKKEFKAFESRRQLSKRYDIFLADERIFRLMHAHLGKEFYKKRKYPVTVNIKKQNLKGEILKAINRTYFILTNRGNTNHLTVAHTGMTENQVVENIMAAVQDITSLVSYGWHNIKAVYVRTEESVSLPLHTSLVFNKWESPANLNHEDIWRLKKQLGATANKSALQEKPPPTPEEIAEAKRFKKKRPSQMKTAASAGLSQKPNPCSGGTESPSKTRKRKVEDDANEDKATVVPRRAILQEKPKAGISAKKAKMTRKSSPGKFLIRKKLAKTEEN